VAIAATAARLACLPATGRITRVVAPQQLQQRPAATAKEELEEEATNAEESFHGKRGGFVGVGRSHHIHVHKRGIY
jgi:hypothetical protein